MAPRASKIIVGLLAAQDPTSLIEIVIRRLVLSGV